MAKFDDFEAVYEPLVLPINGKQYTIPPVVAAEGIKFTLAASGEEDAPFFSDDDMERMLLGPDLKQQLLDDGASDAAVKRVLLTALADFQGGRTAAEIMWATGGDPKAMAEYVRQNAPNRASRRSKPTASARKTH